MKYFLYRRKSTEEAERQALSLEAQRDTVFERFGDLNIVELPPESKSAFTPENRPIFSDMIRRIKKGEVDGIVAWHPDRLARNVKDAAEIIYLLDIGKLKDLKFVSYHFDNTAEGKMMLQITLSQSKYSSDKLSTDVKRGLNAKLESGAWHNTAPIGYRNNKTDKTITVDPIASPFIKIIFDRYASGAYNLRTLTQKMYEDGFRSKKGKRVDKTGIQRILKNPFYYGLMMSNGIPYQGKYQPIISKELFDLANDMLSGKQKSKRQKHVFPLGGIMKCAVCGCALTATIKKEKYIYYYCTNGKHGCTERKKHLTADHATALVADLFSKELPVNERLLDIALRAEEKLYGEGAEQKKATRLNLRKQLAAIKERQDALAMRKNTPEDVYARNMAALSREQIELELQLRKLDNKQEEGAITFEQVKKVFLTANNVAKAFSVANSSLQREYAETILSNISVGEQKIVSYLLKPPFQRIADITDKGDLRGLRPGRVSNCVSV